MLANIRLTLGSLICVPFLCLLCVSYCRGHGGGSFGPNARIVAWLEVHPSPFGVFALASHRLDSSIDRVGLPGPTSCWSREPLAQTANPNRTGPKKRSKTPPTTCHPHKYHYQRMPPLCLANAPLSLYFLALCIFPPLIR